MVVNSTGHQGGKGQDYITRQQHNTANVPARNSEGSLLRTGDVVESNHQNLQQQRHKGGIGADTQQVIIEVMEKNRLLAQASTPNSLQQQHNKDASS